MNETQIVHAANDTRCAADNQQRHPDRQIFGQPADHAGNRRPPCVAVPLRRCRSTRALDGLGEAGDRLLRRNRLSFFTYSVSTSIIAAVMPFGCAMLCARLSTRLILGDGVLERSCGSPLAVRPAVADRSTSVRTGIEPVICEYISGSPDP